MPRSEALAASSPGWPDLALALGFSLLAGLYAYHPIFSSDGLWHLALGRVIHQTGAIPHSDLFSAVHPESEWVQFQWFWEWLAYLGYRLGGFGMLRLLQAGTMAVSLAVTYGVARYLARTRSAAAAVTALALLLFADRFRLRPDAFNLLFVFSLLPLWLSRRWTPGAWQVAALLVLSALWSNVHAGASLLALASVGAVLAGRMAQTPGGLLDRLALQPLRPLGLTLLGLFCSPIFLSGVVHFLGVYGFMVDTGNREWSVSWSMLSDGVDAPSLVIAAAPTVVAVLYAAEVRGAYRRGGRIAFDGGEVLLCAGYLLLAHHAVRNVVLCTVPFLLWCGRVAPRRPRASWWLTGVAALCLVLSVQRHVVQAYGGFGRFTELAGHDLSPGEFPEETAGWMLGQDIRGGIFNHGRWAGYLIWQLYPHGNGVFIDTRYHVTPQMYELFQRSNDPFTRVAAMDTAFRRYGVELALFPEPVLPLDGHSKWRLLYRAGDQALYQHVDGEHARHNLAQRDAWLRAQGVDLSKGAIERQVTRLGGVVWLKAPYQSQRLVHDLQAKSAASLRRAAGLYYRAGDCTRAIALWRQAEKREPLTAVSRVRWAECLESAGAPVAAARALEGLDPRELTRDEAYRLSWLRRHPG